MTAPKRSQAERLFTILRLEGELCAVEPLRWEPPITRVAARIHELRERGYLIDTRRCPNHQGGSTHANYKYTPGTGL